MLLWQPYLALFWLVLHILGMYPGCLLGYYCKLIYTFKFTFFIQTSCFNPFKNTLLHQTVCQGQHYSNISWQMLYLTAPLLIHKQDISFKKSYFKNLTANKAFHAQLEKNEINTQHIWLQQYIYYYAVLFQSLLQHCSTIYSNKWYLTHIAASVFHCSICIYWSHCNN